HFRVHAFHVHSHVHSHVHGHDLRIYLAGHCRILCGNLVLEPIPGASGHCSSLTGHCFSRPRANRITNLRTMYVSLHDIVVEAQYFGYGRWIMFSRGDHYQTPLHHIVS
ncbi:unnamed protein product, partial [Arabidopsis halleri]